MFEEHMYIVNRVYNQTLNCSIQYHHSWNVMQELFKSTVDLADLVGLHLVMSQIAGKGQLKFMIAGVGWASAELIMTGYVSHFQF